MRHGLFPDPVNVFSQSKLLLASLLGELGMFFGQTGSWLTQWKYRDSFTFVQLGQECRETAREIREDDSPPLLHRITTGHVLRLQKILDPTQSKFSLRLRVFDARGCAALKAFDVHIILAANSDRLTAREEPNLRGAPS